MERSGRSVWLAPDLVLTVLTRFRGFGFGSLLLGLGNCPSGKPGNLGAFSTGWPPGLVLTSVTRFRVWSSPVLGLALGLVWFFWPGCRLSLFVSPLCLGFGFRPRPCMGLEPSRLVGCRAWRCRRGVFVPDFAPIPYKRKGTAVWCTQLGSFS